MHTTETASVQSDAASGRAIGGTAMLRLSIPLARVLVAAIALCTALAYTLARQPDDQLEASIARPSQEQSRRWPRSHLILRVLSPS